MAIERMRQNRKLLFVGLRSPEFWRGEADILKEKESHSNGSGLHTLNFRQHPREAPYYRVGRSSAVDLQRIVRNLLGKRTLPERFRRVPKNSYRVVPTK